MMRNDCPTKSDKTEVKLKILVKQLFLLCIIFLPNAV